MTEGGTARHEIVAGVQPMMVEPVVVVDVIFDHGAAHRAAEQLRQSASALMSLLHERADARISLLTIWEGPAAQAHAEAFARTQQHGFEIAERMKRTAARIEDAAGAARREQRRREEEATVHQLAAAGIAW